MYQLANFASQPDKTRGRLYAEPESSTRSPFQRDRDRVLHSGAFRRLIHKTQVFIAHVGDYYRTRLTHSLEVAQIARSISRELKVNEDLAETLALCHDLGHTPFGHAGEEALDKAMQNHGGFDHNAQSLRIVTHLEQRYADFDGLNLTWETLEGLVKHNGPVVGAENPIETAPYAIRKYSEKHDLELSGHAGIEAQIAAISDDIAYNNHDIQDGIKANLFKLEELVELEFFKEIYQKYKNKINKKNYKIAIYQIIRDSIDSMIRDLLSNTEKNIKKFKIKSLKDVSKSNQLIVSFSDKIENSEQEIRSFLRHRMYENKSVLNKNQRGKMIIKKLFKIIKSNPRKFLTKEQLTKDKYRAISDFISGMTDRYAINLYNDNK